MEENIRTYTKLPYKNKMHTIHLHYYNIFTDESVTILCHYRRGIDWTKGLLTTLTHNS
jgi:hypothetical protein